MKVGADGQILWGLARAYRGAIAFLLVIAATVVGQPDFGADYLPAEAVERYADFLDLTDEQREVVRVLHGALLESLAEKQRMMLEAQDAMGPINQQQMGASPEERERLDAAWEEAVETRDKIRNTYVVDAREREEAFFRDMRAVLDESQAERWPRVMLMRTRDVELPSLLYYSWGGVDLVEILRERGVEPAPGGELDELLVRYETDLDRRLKLVRTLRIELEDQWDTFDAISEAGAMDALGQRVGEVQRLNREYARRIGLMLPAEARDAFRDAVKRRAFWTVYAKSRTTLAFETAAGLGDLTEHQQGVIAKLAAEHGGRLAVVNERFAAEKLRLDELSWVEDLEGDPRAREVHDAYSSALGERVDLDRDYADRLRAVLSKDQIAQIPRDVARRVGWDDEGEPGRD